MEAVSERNIADYFTDMDALNILRADRMPRATLCLDGIRALIGELEARGAAYSADGDVYFSVMAKADYGKLSGRDLDQQQEGASGRLADGEEARKHHPFDFALWKGAKPGEPSFPSPWGPGRPGWHIECSAMVRQELGDTIDIHLGGADLIFQIGTAKYGVCNAQGGLDEARLRAVAAHPQVRMFEIKLSQGAKPGKGGILPAAKVTAEIAAIRGIPAGQDSRSPNRHPEIASSAELLDFVARVRTITGKPTGFKLVIGDPDWLASLCQEIQHRGPASAPDFITVDSADGGTGAAPMSLLDYVGLPIQESLPRLVDTLQAHGLRERIRVIASGKLINPSDVAWALCVGADFVNSARGFLFALGCIQSMQCDKNTCPAGITTHNPRLQRGLDPHDKAERVRHYVENMRHEVEIIAHACGVTDPRHLQRAHCRIVVEPGRSLPLDELYQRPPAPRRDAA